MFEMGTENLIAFCCAVKRDNGTVESDLFYCCEQDTETFIAMCCVVNGNSGRA